MSSQFWLKYCLSSYCFPINSMLKALFSYLSILYFFVGSRKQDYYFFLFLPYMIYLASVFALHTRYEKSDLSSYSWNSSCPHCCNHFTIHHLQINIINKKLLFEGCIFSNDQFSVNKHYTCQQIDQALTKATVHWRHVHCLDILLWVTHLSPITYILFAQ